MSKSAYPLHCPSPIHISTYETLDAMRRSVYVRIRPYMDKAVAVLMLALSSPVLLAAMFAVRSTSRGPTVYSQVRVGRDGRLFRIFKIRSMYHECENQSGVQWSQPGDPRVTRVGRYLRATHIDELPQLINVLRGDMSLIGPRPERPAIVEQLELALPHYRERLAVLPGLTGLAQIQLPPDSDLGGVASKLLYDLYYVQHMNFLLDFRILLCTPLHVLGIPSLMLNRWLGIPAMKGLECGCTPKAGSLGVPWGFHPPVTEGVEAGCDGVRQGRHCATHASAPESNSQPC